MTELEDALEEFDGKATSLLSEIKARFGDSPAFMDELIRLADCESGHVSAGATWLIKNLLEDGGRLSEQQTQDFLGRLNGVSDWQSQLHVCQSFQYLGMPAELAGACAAWLTPILRSDRPFLRGWSMDALQHLASRAPELGDSAAAALRAAEADPAASVRARARRWRR